MSRYTDRLKDPRWQKRRSEILMRDHWTCRKCDDKTKTLHVHHIIYFAGLEPWNYPDHLLVTLCEDCHKDEECEKDMANAQLVETIRSLGAMNSDVFRIIQILRECHVARGSLGTLALLQLHLDAAWQEARK